MTWTARLRLLALLLAAVASALGGLASCGGDDTQPSPTAGAGSGSPTATASSPAANDERQAAIDSVISRLEANGNTVDRGSATAVKLSRGQALDALTERTAAGRTPFGPELTDAWVVELRVELHPKAQCEKRGLQNCDTDPEKTLGSWLQMVLPNGLLGPNAFTEDPGQPLG